MTHSKDPVPRHLLGELVGRITALEERVDALDAAARAAAVVYAIPRIPTPGDDSDSD